MLSLKKKYFIQKVVLGLCFVLIAASDKFIPESDNWILWIVVGVSALIYAYSFFAKSEVQDERARLNILKSKSRIYEVICMLLLINAVMPGNGTKVITSSTAFYMIGIFQIAEYIYFLINEKDD